MPAPDRPTIPEVIPLIEAYYAEHPTGGSLHLVLDDGNIRRRYVAWCRRYAEKQGDEAGVELAELLLRMSISQRRRIVTMHAYEVGKNTLIEPRPRVHRRSAS